MSSLEYKKGKLMPVTKEEILGEFPKADVNDLEWDTKGKYIFSNDGFYRVEYSHNENDSSPNFSYMNTNKDGSIDFHCQYYNGGTCLLDLVDEYLEGENSR